MRIGNRQFSGQRPKIDAWNLQDNEAQLAIDCELTSTGIRAMRKNSLVKTVPLSTQMIYHKDGLWLTWDKPVCIVESPIGVEPRRLYWTGDGAPKQATAAEYSRGLSFRVGVPTPEAPTVSEAHGSESVTGSVDITTLYIATFVNRFGDEGDHSKPSELVNFKYGQSITVSGLGDTDANSPSLNEYNTVVATRIYVLSEGESRFLAELPLTTQSYTHDTANDTLGDGVVTSDFVPPPEDMQGLHMMSNDVALGFVGKTVYVSEPGQLNAWPYSFPVQSEIVGISSFDNTAVILTKGYPEVATIYNPSNITPTLLAEREPCVSRRSIVQASGGVMYAAPSGLFFISGSGGTMLTEKLLDKQYWDLLKPETIHAAYRDGEYYAWHDGTYHDFEGRCLIFDTREPNAVLRQMTAYSSAAHVMQGTDEMFLADGGLLDKFQGSDERLSYRWLSKEHGVGNPVAFTTARVISRELTNASIREALEAFTEARDAAIARNASALLLRSNLSAVNGYGGAINQDVLGGAGYWQIPGAPETLEQQERGVAINNGADRRLPKEVTQLFLNVLIHADSQLIDQTSIGDEEPYRITYWDRVRHWEYELFGNVDVQQFDMAGSESELHSGS